MAEGTVCRTCMKQETNMTNLFEPFSQGIITMIEFCTGILLQKDDSKPSHICANCIKDLHIAHKFKMKCVDSEKALQELIKPSNGQIKREHEMEGNIHFIKIEGCLDYDMSNRDSHFGEKLAEDTIYKSKCDIKMSGTEAIKKDKVSIKREKKLVGRRAKVPAETKVKSQRVLNNVKRLYCEPCKVGFNNRKESLEHKKKLHKEDKMWICEVCGKSYAHRSSQIAHMHSHYSTRYACDHCEYSTYNKYDLGKHIRIHTGDKLYKCTQCTAAYRTSSNLRMHVRLLHERTRAHTCHVCGKAYNDRATLNRHIDAHNDIKRFMCDVCHACFSRRCYWKRHLQTQHDIVIPNCRPGRPRAVTILVERTNMKTKKSRSS